MKTLFSTDVVHFRDDGSEAFSRAALSRWLEVTFPLTVFTLCIAFFVFRLADKPRRNLLHDEESATFQRSVDQQVFYKGYRRTTASL